MISIFISFFSFLASNPVPPVLFSELYFEEDEWTIEIYDYYGFFAGMTLNSCEISSSADTVQFNDGIYINFEEVLLITNDDLQSPLSINKTGDYVKLFGNVFDDEIIFGDYPGSQLNTVYDGQSFVRVSCGNMFAGEDFYLAKENQPSLGSNPFSVNTRGVLSGYVYDINDNPVNSARIDYHPSDYLFFLYTDENGYFSNTQMYGMNYSVTVCIDDTEYGNGNFTIEPDSTTFIELHTNYQSNKIQDLPLIQNTSLSNYPNPFYPTVNTNTTISFVSHSDTENTDKLISIYNQKGQKIITFECINSFDAQAMESLSHITWNGRDENEKLVNSGVYFYVLELDGREVSSNKMIVLR